MQKIWQQNEGQTQNDIKRGQTLLLGSLTELSSPTLECMATSRITAISPISVYLLFLSVSFQGKTTGSEQ